MRFEDLDYSPEIMRKAFKAARLNLVEQDADVPAIWWVRSERDPSLVYRVQSDINLDSGHLTWVTCTCPHGLHKGGGRTKCYHSAAALSFALIKHEDV